LAGLSRGELFAGLCVLGFANGTMGRVQGEKVWAFLRANKLSALVWDTYDAIVDACVSAWHFLLGYPERIRSIGSRSWACVSL